MKIYTLGYQNLPVESYVQALVNAGIGLVLDVREHAWSQRRAFIKSNLSRSLSAVGIEYSHVKEAGNPSSNRKTARNAAECMARYRQYLRRDQSGLNELIRRLDSLEQSGRSACLSCYERRAEDCHRSVLILELMKMRPDLTSIHLQPTFERPNQSKRCPTKHSLTTSAFLAPGFLPFM